MCTYLLPLEVRRGNQGTCNYSQHLVVIHHVGAGTSALKVLSFLSSSTFIIVVYVAFKTLWGQLGEVLLSFWTIQKTNDWGKVYNFFETECSIVLVGLKFTE